MHVQVINATLAPYTGWNKMGSNGVSKIRQIALEQALA